MPIKPGTERLREMARECLEEETECIFGCSCEACIKRMADFAEKVVLPKVMEIITLDAVEFAKRYPQEWDGNTAVDLIIAAAIRREFGLAGEKEERNAD